MKYIVHTDGGSRGNPGAAGVGVVIEKEVSDQTSDIRHQTSDNAYMPEDGKLQTEGNKLVAEFGKVIGETTNNVAEYTAVIEALKYLVSHKTPEDGDKNEVFFFLDSALVVNQMNGLFKVKDSKMRELLTQARILEGQLSMSVRYAAVPREQNRRADELVNEALDSMG